MKQGLSAALTGQLAQQQHLAQNLQRSLELLALPLPELESRLIAELSVNPLLESGALSDLPAAEIPEKTAQAPETEDENDFESNSILPEEWSDQLPWPVGKAADNDEKSDYMASLAAPPPQLRSELLSELHSMPLPENILKLACEVVSALNDDGFLAVNPADIAMQCDADMSEVMEAVHLVQQIAPAGIGARDLPECLKLQLQRQNKWNSKFAALLDEGLADLEKNRPDLLMKKLSLSKEELGAMLKTLRSLDPAPGRRSASSAVVLIPDLIITRDAQGNYRAVTRQTAAMKVRVSPYYEKLLEDKSLSEEDRAYVSENLSRAKELIKAVAMRQSTLQLLGDLLIIRQREFLDKGKAFLKPMTMKSVAEELQLSESTISRTAADKLADTPQGVVPIRFFFSSGVDSADGGEVSNRAVMEKIRQLIEAEDSSAPLSDDALAKLLKADGILLARRTVAKYRESMKIPSSSIRKKFF